MTVSFRSNSSPMAGKVVPKPGTIKPNPSTTTPMSGKVIRKIPVKKGIIVAGVLAFVALMASLFKSNKELND